MEPYTTISAGGHNIQPPKNTPSNQPFSLEMQEASENSGQLLEDESCDHDIESKHIFGIENNDLDSDGEQVIVIESNDLENDNEQVLEFESNDLENDSDQMLEIENNDRENDIFGETTMIDDQDGISQQKGYPPPVIGMEFESYDDAYKYYNFYARELGFAIRVKSSWTKRNSKEKRGAVLCCNCEGFKTLKEASSRRKETRTGCLAMIRLRLVESNRWRVDEVKLEHNHLFDLERAQSSKSHKKMDTGGKRKLELDLDIEVQTIKLYRTPAADTLAYGNPDEREVGNHVDRSNCLKIKIGEAQVICDYFSRAQLKNPNFFYVMDFNDEGYVRNVFWVDSRSRAAYGYFCDVVAVDRTCLSNKFEIPLLAFVGINHHGQSILLGSGLLADESIETYIWLLRAWLTCMSGRPPQTIITDQSKGLQSAIAEVFPRAHHRLSLSLAIQGILGNLGDLRESELFKTVLSRTIFKSLKVDEFETAWEVMIQRFGLIEHDGLQELYENRELWAPVYSKDTFFAGVSTSLSMSPYFDGYVHRQTSLKEFFVLYETVVHEKNQKEARDDSESKESCPVLKSACKYELQLSEVYTKEIFLKCQEEVKMMLNCVSVNQVHASGPIITYTVKEGEDAGSMRAARNFEVVYDKVGLEVRCICGGFNFNGYLCRHSLSVLNYNGIEEIPSQYILPRWRKDCKRLYVPDLRFNNVDISNPVQWFDHLYRQALGIVEEGITSQDHYMVAWQAFKESLNKVRLVADKHV